MRENPIIVFDGMCMLCSMTAEFVLKRDRRRRIRFATAQNPAGRAAYLEHGLDAEAMATMIVIIDGEAYTESDAALALLAALGWPWRLALAGRIVPRSLRDRLYRWVARNRYGWFGARDVCWHPAADAVERMM